MTRTKQLSIIFLLLTACVASRVVDAQDPANIVSRPPAEPEAAPDLGVVENTDIRAILKAMGDADAKTLFDLYQSTKDPVVHALAAMAIERTRYHLDAASKDAKVCETSMFDSKPAIALLCSQFIAGNLRLAGDYKAANAKTAESIQRYRGHHLDKALSTMQTSLDRENALPDYAIERPTGDVVLALSHDKNTRIESLRPILAAKANGHEFDLVFDTGATGLVLGEDYARDFGVKPLDGQGHTRGWISKDIEVKFGLLDALQIGAITFRNVPVRILPKKIALLGTDVLAPLGTLQITKKNLTIYAENSQSPTCDRDMQIGSGLAGRGFRILPTFLLNEQPHSVMLDTGAGFLLLGSKAAVDEVKKLGSGHMSMNDIGGRHPFSNVDAAKVDLTIDRQPFKITFLVYTESDMPHDITLGANALQYMDFILDFRHQHLCFPMHADLH